MPPPIPPQGFQHRQNSDLALEGQTVAQFCEEISVPLEVIANALFLATQKGADSRFAAQMLQFAGERLQDVRAVVSANCRLDEAQS